LQYLESDFIDVDVLVKKKEGKTFKLGQAKLPLFKILENDLSF